VPYFETKGELATGLINRHILSKDADKLFEERSQVGLSVEMNVLLHQAEMTWSITGPYEQMANSE